MTKLNSWSLSQIHGIETEPITWPDEFSSNSRGSISLTAEAIHLTHLGELRLVNIISPKICIINLFFYPQDASELPVYAMEYVRFGPKAVVGVVDMKWLPEHRTPTWIANTMTAVSLEVGDLPRGQEMPKWYEECRSGNDFFLRPENEDDLDRSVMCHQLTWLAFLKKLSHGATRVTNNEPEICSKLVSQYKDHHRINSPGLPFLNRTFGKPWTDTFLSEFYFK
ncbi:MAG: hypothetical protein AAFX93_18355 [Verrucomicrobiota bacterium]